MLYALAQYDLTSLSLGLTQLAVAKRSLNAAALFGGTQSRVIRGKITGFLGRLQLSKRSMYSM